VNEKLRLGEIKKQNTRWDRWEAAFSQGSEDVQGNNNENIKKASKTCREKLSHSGALGNLATNGLPFIQAQTVWPTIVLFEDPHPHPNRNLFPLKG